MAQLTIALTRQEMEKLRRAAKAELRHPRDEARLIIRRALLSDTMPTNNNTGAKTAKPDAGVAETAQ